MRMNVNKPEQPSAVTPGQSSTANPANKPAKTRPAAKQPPVFKVQILTSSKALSTNDKRFKGLKGIESYREDGLYKYTYGASTDYNEILRIRKNVARKMKDAFIIAFRNGKKIDTTAAIREFKENKK